MSCFSRFLLPKIALWDIIGRMNKNTYIFSFFVLLRCRFVPGECWWCWWPFPFIRAHSKVYQLFFSYNCGWQWMKGMGVFVPCTCMSLIGMMIAAFPHHPLIGSKRSLRSGQMLSPWASNGICKPSFLWVVIMVLRGICVVHSFSLCHV